MFLESVARINVNQARFTFIFRNFRGINFCGKLGKSSLNFVTSIFFSDLAIKLKVTQMLTYSKVRRCIMCGFELKGIIALDLFTIFKKANIKFYRLELIGLSLRLLPADTFHRLIGEQINADQYFIDGMRNADPDHFNSKFFEKPSISSAEDVTGNFFYCSSF